MIQVTRSPIRELVENIAKALVDDPGAVQVEAVEGSQVVVLELRAGAEDVGKVIGCQGRTVNAIRTLLGVAGMKLHKRFRLDVVSDEISKSVDENRRPDCGAHGGKLSAAANGAARTR